MNDITLENVTEEELAKAFMKNVKVVYADDTAYWGTPFSAYRFAEDLIKTIQDARKPRFEHGAAYCAYGQITSGIYQRRTDGWQLLHADSGLYFADDSEYVTDYWLDSLVKLVPEVTE